MEEIKDIDCEEGGVHSGKLWSLKRKLCPKTRDPPTAMMDPEGNLITSANAIQNLALNTYKERLRNRKIKDDLKHIQTMKEELCRQRIEIAKETETPPWTMQDLEIVLKNLKKINLNIQMKYFVLK